MPISPYNGETKVITCQYAKKNKESMLVHHRNDSNIKSPVQLVSHISLFVNYTSSADMSFQTITFNNNNTLLFTM